MTQTLSLLPFGPAHLDGALRLSRAAGWPHRREDWQLVADISQGVVALDHGQVVATALVTPYGDVGMVNMILVDEPLRGRGLGRLIMDRAMALIQPRDWRLVATPSGLPLYQKLGFAACGQVQQHQGAVAALPAPPGIRWAKAADLDAITDMDALALRADRRSLLQALAQRGRIAVQPGQGYAVIRPFGRGQVVGPVVADSLDTAQALTGFLFAGQAGSFMRVDTTGECGLGLWLSQIGLAEVDRPVAMQTATPHPPGDFTRFALAAQALG